MDFCLYFCFGEIPYDDETFLFARNVIDEPEVMTHQHECRVF